MKYTEEQLETMIGSKMCQNMPGMKALFEQRLEKLRATKAKRSAAARERLKDYQFKSKDAANAAEGSGE